MEERECKPALSLFHISYKSHQQLSFRFKRLAIRFFVIGCLFTLMTDNINGIRRAFVS
jgi:hypothetical protein